MQKQMIKKPAFLSYWDMNKIAVKAGDGSIEYKKCPSLSEKQQCLSEYSLPLILPGMFYLLNLSPFALYWCLIIVVGHTIETALTNFGHSVKCFRISGQISPLMHHLIDCGWLHTLISAMLLKPSNFTTLDTSAISSESENDVVSFLTENEWHVIYMALLLIQTLPIYLAVSFKTDYLKQNQQDRFHPKSVSFIGLHIRRCFVWYLFVTGWIYVASFFPTLIWRGIGVLILNIIPLGQVKRYSSFSNLNKEMTN